MCLIFMTSSPVADGVQHIKNDCRSLAQAREGLVAVIAAMAPDIFVSHPRLRRGMFSVGNSNRTSSPPMLLEGGRPAATPVPRLTPMLGPSAPKPLRTMAGCPTARRTQRLERYHHLCSVWCTESLANSLQSFALQVRSRFHIDQPWRSYHWYMLPT